jgi:hypothetical protein
LILALIILNLMFVVFIFVGNREFRQNQYNLMSMMIDLTGKSQDMLSKCIVLEKKSNFEIELLKNPYINRK